MTDSDRPETIEHVNIVNEQVIALAPAVSLGHNMLALSSALANVYISAANQQQLNGMTAMATAMQNINGASGAKLSQRTTTEAMDLLKQVIAAVQAE
jgi:hypothetical protein